MPLSCLEGTVSEIASRWEWRSFGTCFPKAELALAALAPVSISESDETYFLTSTDVNVKIRDLLLDIKALRKRRTGWPRAVVARSENNLSLGARNCNESLLSCCVLRVLYAARRCLRL